MPVDLLQELEPVTSRLLERHLATTKEWFPHQHVPFERAKNISHGDAWSVEQADLGGAAIDDALRSALYVNLLTEDNLPYYFRTIEAMVGRDNAWGEWSRRWTAEEGRHSMAIYSYVTVTRAIDPVQLERGRMVQVSTGQVPQPKSVAHTFAYVAMQELATRISHRNTGQMIGDPAGYEVMMRVAGDENLHHLFYRDLTSAAFDADPDATMVAVADEMEGFAMPGLGIPGFIRHAAAIAKAGIYDPIIHHEQILLPLVQRHWLIEARHGLSAIGEQARDRIMALLDKSAKAAAKMRERRGHAAALATA